jgi:aspartate kinase
MGLIVHKYGGTSVGDLDRIRNVADRVKRTREEGQDVVVIVSAMSGETDRLIRMAHDVSPTPVEREYDMLISTGEQVSMALLSIALNGMDCPAVSLTGYQVGILTDSSHSKARILDISTDKIRERLTEGKVVIIAGFQGVDINNEITTLGRGGSDTSAIAVAAVLKADLCEIYTDVDGVYTADPRVVKSAKKLARISHDEMLEMAGLGAKVLQSRSVEFAKKYNVPMSVRSSFTDEPGTLIVEETKDMEKAVVTGIAMLRYQARVNVLDLPNTPGIAAKIFNAISAEKINVDMIVLTENNYGGTDISFTVHKNDLKKAKEICERVSADVSAKGVTVEEGVGKVSVVGVGMRSQPGVAADVFDALGSNGINIEMITTSEIKISCLVKEEDLDKAANSLHERFHPEDQGD